jgi:hypothetical protein
MSENQLATITTDEFGKMTPKEQAAVLVRETEHLSYAVQKLWQNGQPTKKELSNLWERSKGVHTLAYMHDGMTYKGW